MSGPPQAGRPGRGVARLAMSAAVLAVLLSLASLGVAGWALNKADQASDALAALPPPPPGGPPGAGVPPPPVPEQTSPDTGGVVEPEPEPEGSGPAGTGRPLDPQAVFTPSYEKRNLSVQVPVSCCDVRGIDLDEPRVNPVNGRDISVRAGRTRGVPNLTFADGVTAASTESVVSPNQCAEQIQLAPLVPDERYPLRKGDVYCILTSQADADARGIPQKMTVVGITGISADSIVTMQVTAFNVPR